MQSRIYLKEGYRNPTGFRRWVVHRNRYVSKRRILWQKLLRKK